MSIFLTLAYLFFIGSVIGWVLELLYRNLSQRNKKWMNPGFCTGPYLPIYGFGLCALYLLASLEQYSVIADPVWNKIVLFVSMAIGMTLIEYVAGIFCLKVLKVRLWDYSDLWGNLQGIICPQFSVAWALLGALYYFFIHPYILNGLNWLAQNLAFSFFIGMFFGVFLIDVVNSAQLIVKLKRFAEENRVVLTYDGIKEHIQNFHQKKREKYHFFAPFRSQRPLADHLKEITANLEKQKRKSKQGTDKTQSKSKR